MDDQGKKSGRNLVASLLSMSCPLPTASMCPRIVVKCTLIQIICFLRIKPVLW